MDIAMDPIYHVHYVIPTYLSFYMFVALEWTEEDGIGQEHALSNGRIGEAALAGRLCRK